nr:PREDICTED: PAX-interacting protein 1 [Bos mutus]
MWCGAEPVCPAAQTRAGRPRPRRKPRGTRGSRRPPHSAPTLRRYAGARLSGRHPITSQRGRASRQVSSAAPGLAVCCSDLARGLHLPSSLCAYPASVSAPVCSGILLAQSFAPISVYTDGFTQCRPVLPLAAVFLLCLIVVFPADRLPLGLSFRRHSCSPFTLFVSPSVFKRDTVQYVGRRSSVIQLLKAGKAKEVSYNALASHIISEDGDNPEVGEAREVFDLPVVKPSWVILSVQCGALLPVNGFSPESCQIFFGITACLSQVSPEDRSALWAMLTFHGGGCQLNLNRKCTHLVVPEPKGEKYECALRRASIKIVTPDWVLDCISEKTRKDEALYHPRLIVYEEEEEEEEEEEGAGNEEPDSPNEGSTDGKSSPASSQEGSPSGEPPFSPKSSAEKSKGELMFDDSSDSSPEKQERNLNWTPAEVPQLAAAKRRLPPGKEPGLINLCANVPPVPGGILPPEVRGSLLAPGQSLQGPERPEVMAAWSPAMRTLRNITNNADIQQMSSRPSNVAHILQSLSAPTKTLEQQVNHSQQGPASAGHDPAVEIPEEGFLLGCVFAIADYPEQMSDKQLLATWKRIIQAHGGAVDPTFSSRCTHLLCESQVSGLFAQAMKERKRCITAHWLNTVLKKKKLVPPHRALHFPVAFPPGGKPCSQHIISVTGFVDNDRDDLKLMAYLAGAKYTGYLCRSNTVLICREPTGLKYEKAKEWRIPCVNAQWLGDILLGNFEALRQTQYGRYTAFGLQDPFAPTPQLVLNLLDAWRVPLKVSSELLMGVRLPPKPKQNEVTNVQPSSKRARIEDIPPPTKKLTPELTPFVLFTGFEPVQVQQYIKKLYILGGEVAESAQKCTHLIASKVTRTVKFLTAISVVKHIVTPEWLEECFKCQKFVDEQNYLLRDAEAEVLFSFSLEESLRRAHASPLFKAKYFYITPGICPSLSTMKAIVECAGGKVLSRQPSFRKLMEHKQNKSLSEIVLISCENDLHLCREYFARGIDVHNAEFVLTGVLTQTLDYESYKFN